MTAQSGDQTDVFRRDEGDNWFERNRGGLGQTGDDRVIDMAVRLADRLPLRSICELGCSNGWRLPALAAALPQVERLSGCDLSKAAIDDGRARWPEVEFSVGSLDSPGLDGPFDVVIVSFVFHWVARDRLAASIAAVDSLVGSALIIADFLPDRPCIRPYHHRSDVPIFTYKQDYARCFTDLGTYQEAERSVFAHSGGSEVDIDPQDRAVCSLLLKDRT